jgi:hypothetical protein
MCPCSPDHFDLRDFCFFHESLSVMPSFLRQICSNLEDEPEVLLRNVGKAAN